MGRGMVLADGVVDVCEEGVEGMGDAGSLQVPCGFQESERIDLQPDVRVHVVRTWLVVVCVKGWRDLGIEEALS